MILRTQVLLALGLCFLAFGPSFASIEAGKKIVEKQCLSCHSVGQGKRLGCDLKGVTAKYDRAWLKRMIQEPNKLIAEGDATATKLLKEYNNIPMPNLGITAEQAESILLYLDSVK